MTLRHALVLALASACAEPAKRAAPRPPEPHASVQLQLEHHLLATVPIEGEPHHAALADRMATHRIPGLSIAVFDDYQLVYAAAYGVSDVTTGDRVSTTTLFQAASISKPVNALAVMLVAADGKLELDAPINDALRTWKLPDNELTRASPVTLRRLLAHNAGTTVHGFPGYATDAARPTTVQILDGTPPANTPPVRVDVLPGSIVRYSGGGTTITQLALVDTLSQPYPEILSERVLAPLGMGHSTFEQPLPVRLLPRAAAGHLADGSVVPGKHHVYPEMAPAGLWTTPSDLATFFAELSLAHAGRSTHVSREIADAMTTRVDAESVMGLGVGVAKRNGVVVFGHGGANEGFQSHAIAGLDGGYGVIVMTNSDNGHRLFPEIERTVFAALGSPAAEPPLVRVALTPAQRERLLGTFLIEGRGGPFTITTTAKGFASTRPFRAAVELVPVAADTLVSVEDGMRFTLSGDALALSEHGEQVASASRIPSADESPLLLLAAGDFSEAVAAWKDLLRRDPGSALAGEEANVGYALSLLEDDVESALVVLRAVDVVFPDSARATKALGLALATKGEAAAAVATYERALGKLDADATIPGEHKAAWRSEVEQEIAELGLRAR